ncbi:unnamed protein product, partial [marine sediment metagenome]
ADFFEFTDAEWVKAEYGKKVVAVKDKTNPMRQIERATL